MTGETQRSLKRCIFPLNNQKIQRGSILDQFSASCSLFIDVIQALVHICRWSFGIVLWEIATHGKCSVILCTT